MPETYDQFGVRFQYPDNWQVETGEESDSQQVTVSSPNTAFWSLSLFPEDIDSAQLVEETLLALRAEYPELECEPVEEVVADHRLAGFDINFYCMELTNTAQVRVFQCNDAVCMLLAQSEDRELTAVAPVFRAMTRSLLED